MKKKLIISLTAEEFKELLLEAFRHQSTQKNANEASPKDVANLYSRLEVAKLFGVSNTTIDKWRRRSILPPIIKIASRVYFQKDQILELLKKKQRQPELFTND